MSILSERIIVGVNGVRREFSRREWFRHIIDSRKRLVIKHVDGTISHVETKDWIQGQRGFGEFLAENPLALLNL